MIRKTLIGITASMAILGFASSAQASVFFQVDDNTGLKMSLDKAKDSSSAFGTVLTTDDIAITATGMADFSNGSATIKPVKNGQLTTLTFTPANANAFDGFSFRGEDIAAGQVIDVIIQDNQGHAAQTITFTEGVANADFARQGIIAALPGETIKSVEIVDSGGFEEAKQFQFDPVASAAVVPEPGAWMLMIAGFGLLGAALRRKEINLLKA